ncbi:sterol desaturase family protein [uncultured Mucilaginibacter sp.]|uniref:sterol desaturase family protein n=1 Tax=uncultured Mucilaginibacter sp. TaxID=797541 RepID=UPI0025CBDFDA|nr:sterol desaturase family protein [uncultured Mucilaginibacter sp.]
MGTGTTYLAIAIPFFILLMLGEYYVSKKKKLNVHNLHNSIANISIGIAERLTDILVSGTFYFVYDDLQHRFGIFHIKPGIASWIILLLLTDLIWYWYHRLAHEVNIFWMVHVVHHQSEEFNYTVSARITVLQALVRTGFWCLLPIVGFPAPMIAVMLLIHGLYPFFVHTRVIGKLGILEKILVTPSHHRVHHACNEQYLDKNYGDVFIIWDKLFGTFAEEHEEPVYGLTKQLRTYSFLWQHFHFLFELVLTIRAQTSFKNKLKVIFGSPTLIDPRARLRAERIFRVKQTKTRLGEGLNSYVIWQVILLIACLSAFIYCTPQLGVMFKGLFAIFTILSLINCGAIMEQKKWVFNVEFLRLLVVISIAWPYCRDVNIAPAIIVTGLLLLILFYRTAQKKYLRVVYAVK